VIVIARVRRHRVTIFVGGERTREHEESVHSKFRAMRCLNDDVCHSAAATVNHHQRVDGNVRDASDRPKTRSDDTLKTVFIVCGIKK
jgi:hypothetical protein